MNRTYQCYNSTCVTSCTIPTRASSSYEACNFTCLLNSADSETQSYNYSETILFIFSIVITLVNIPPVINSYITKINRKNIQSIHFHSLSAANILVGMSMSIFFGMWLMKRSYITYGKCLVTMVCLAASLLNSHTQLLLICINRLYLFIKMRNIFENRKSLFIIVALTFASTVCFVISPMLLFHFRLNQECPIYDCQLSALVNRKVMVYITSLFSVVGFAIIAFYVCLLCKLCRFYYRIGKVLPTHKNTNAHARVNVISPRRNKGILILGGMVLTYFVCNTPIHVMMLILTYGANETIPHDVRYILIIASAIPLTLSPLFSMLSCTHGRKYWCVIQR